jgi:glycosyltransferase involved in cell wall biosynthesis
MINNKKLVVVMPAYNAGQTLEQTYREIPFDIVDEVILVDDQSADDTVEVARALGISHVIRHDRNRGYGGNQKTCYDKALEIGADIVVMVHPDYQYTPLLLTAMSSLIALGVWPVVFGSRILGKGALTGGMPRYKYAANRFLTLVQNLLIGQKLSEYHTGYRAYSAEVLRAIDYHANSDDFVFDNEMISQIFMAGFEIGEVSCPTKYFEEASSISLSRSVKYGLGVLRVSVQHLLHRTGIRRFHRYQT